MKNPGKTLSAIAALIAAFILTVPLQAQENAGTINGRVTDKSDAVIPGVTVTLTSPAVQGEKSTVTDEAGLYRFILLPPGTYTVKYELPGFKTVVREGIIVQGSRTVTLQIALEVATVAETVTVTGESPVVDVQNATVGVAFNTTLLRDIPNQRDVWAVLSQTPGVSITGTLFDVGGSTAGTQKGYRGYGISGQVWITVDGVSTTEGTSGAGMYYDYGAFSEITVQAAANSAEVAVPGVYTTTVMKTGGNQIHGEGYADWENSRFQSDNITQSLKDRNFSTPDKFARYNDFNFNAGGPFIKDRFWWFTSLKNQYSGLTTALNNSATDLTGGGPFTTTLGGISVKLNYQLSPKNQAVWSYQRTTKAQPYRNGQGATAKNYIIDSTQDEEAVYFTTKGQFTSVVTNRMTLDTAWLWYHLYDPRYAHVHQTPWSDGQTGIVRGAFGAENDTYRNRHQFYANLAYNRSGLGGNHDFKFGYGEIYENNGGKNDCEFNDTAHSAIPCVTLTYNNGVPATAQINDGPLKDTRNDLLNTYIFAQDKWQIGRKLTLNLGVRYDRYSTWYPAQGNPGTGPFASTQFFPTATYGTQYPRRDMPGLPIVVPRLAFVYAPFGNTKTALKGSYGRYGENTGTLTSSIRVNPQAIHTATYNVCSATTTANCAFLPITTAGLSAIVPTRTSAQAVLPAIDPKLKDTYWDEYTAGIEQEIMHDLGVSALFVRKIQHQVLGTLDRTYLTSDYAPLTGIDLGPSGLLGAPDNRRVTIFERIAPLRAQDLLVTNFPAGNNDSTIEFNLTKRMTSKWQFMTGFDWTKLNAAGSTQLDPNSLLYQSSTNVSTLTTYGHQHQWTYKALGIYMLPKGIQLSGTFNSQKGAAYSRTMQFASSLKNILNPDGTTRTRDLNQGTGSNNSTFTMEPNAYYLPAVNLISLRAEKMFHITDRQSVDAMFDLYNMFNWNTEIGRDSVTARVVSQTTGQSLARFGLPNSILSPRIFKLGARYRF